MKRIKRLLSGILALAMALSACAGCRNSGTPVLPEQPGGEEQTEGDPVLHGVENVTVTAGKYFDFTSGISAVSAGGDDLTSRIAVSGDVNTSKAGTYTLVYSVTDDGGRTASAERVVTVKENPALSETESVYLYTSETAYNIARGCEATASNTSNGSASLALDGDATTRWECDRPVSFDTEEEYLVDYTVDLGAVVETEGVSILWEAAYATDFLLQISSDGSEFETVERVSGYSFVGPGATQTFSFESAKEARFVRLHLIRRATIYAYSVYELQVFGKQGTVIPAEKYPVLYRGGGAVADEQWLLFDLGSSKTFDRMNVEQVDWKSPAEYEILFSDENTERAWEAAEENGQKFTLEYGTGKLFVNGGRQTEEVTARFVKIAMHKRSFADYSYIYRKIEIKYGGDTLDASVSASSAEEGFGAENLKNGGVWKSEYGAHVEILDFKDYPASNRKEGTLYAQVFDLGEVKDVGRADLVWRGDDGGKGKYYDLQVSTNGIDYTTVFRQTHGDTQKQSVYVYESARYLRVIDYQNTSDTAFMLENITVHSQYPNESKVNYDVTVRFPDSETVETQNGSYISGGTDFPTARLVAYLDDSLRGKPVPSNDWWQSLLVGDKGNNLYLNPLTATFRGDGLWLTNPGDGYYSGDNPGNGRQTIDVDAHDIRIGYEGMKSAAKVRVTGYSDYGISAVMTDHEKVDKLTVFLSQGALYAYCLFAEPQKATVASDHLIAVYDLGGNEILKGIGDTYQGDCIILCVRTHSGYANGIANGNEEEYEERYYVLSAPASTNFVREESVIRAVMSEGNYLSLGAMSSVNTVSSAQAGEPFAHGSPDLTEAALLHEHGYAFIVGTTCSYTFDAATNEVSTEYSVRTVCLRQDCTGEAITAFMPHHYKNSARECSQKYVYKTVRGDSRAYAGNVYTTTDRFYGVVPTFTEPDDGGYSAKVLYGQLLQLYRNVGGDKSPAQCNLISGDPYWQGKNLHPMAMAVLAADQIGATDLRDGFLAKIRFILTDWFCYTPGNEPNDAYFYYDKEWGTLYYKNSEFGAGVNLADHHFTYGYYTLAAGVLCAYEPDFADEYGDMIELLIRDYMTWDRDDELFPYMRNYDVFAGHSWAGGYADNEGGNNQESAGEALNSWVGAYLYATAVGNEEIRTAAIYGFTTELAAIKQYWFNYGGDSFAEFYPYGTLGQLYGASNFFGTFFNGEPLYMYGIHLIPGEEFLTGYALDETERTRLKEIVAAMRMEQANWDTEESHKTVYAWQHVFIPIVAIYDPDEAIAWYDDLQGDVGNSNEQFNVYYLVHAMKSYGFRTKDIWAENGASATVYQKDGIYRAVCWNPTGEEKLFTFRSENGVTGSALVPARSLVSVDPAEHTQKVERYVDGAKVTPQNYAQAENVSLSGEYLSFENGKATYLLSCGDGETYRSVVLEGSLQGARLYLDGKETVLNPTETGYASEPCILTFKHTVEIYAQSGVLRGISFENRSLSRISLDGAVATASSELGTNVAQNALDGEADTRWESVHGQDETEFTIRLAETETVYQMQIVWEAASAAEYEVYFSLTGEEDGWTKAYEFSSGTGARTDVVTPDVPMRARYIKIVCKKRATNYGYSVYEINLFGMDRS